MAQKAGGIAAFVDAEHALDPAWAQIIGVNLDDLLISQPDTGEQALEITETILPRGNPPTPNAWSKVKELVEITSNPGTLAPGSPKRIIDPLPYCVWICSIAKLTAFLRCSTCLSSVIFQGYCTISFYK